MKKIFGLICIITASLLIGGCGGSSKETGSKVEKKKTVNIATDATYAPFEYMDKGEIVGFDIELIKEVAKEAGYDYKLVNTAWDPLFASVQGKQVDLAVSSITITDQRKETYDFSVPYYESASMIMVKEGSDIKSAKDLENVKVGVLNGSTSMEIVEGMFGKEAKNISKYESNPLAVLALKNGEVKAVICDNATAEEYVKNNPKDKIVAIPDKEAFDPEYYGLMFPKGSEIVGDFDKALEKVMKDGKYKEIYKKYFGVEPDLSFMN